MESTASRLSLSARDGFSGLSNEELRQVVREVLQQRDLREHQQEDGGWQGSYKLGELLMDLVEVLAVPEDWLREALPAADFRCLVEDEVLKIFESAWQLFVFDDGWFEDRCRACCWVPDVRHAVLAQCSRSKPCDELPYCATHASKRRHGEWRVGMTLAEVPSTVRRSVKAEATRRARRCFDEEAGAGAQGFNVPVGRQGQSGVRKVKFRVPYKQKEFAPAVSGEPREYSQLCLALPLFVCQLCQERSFATKQALQRHLVEEHVSELEARKAFFYREGCRPRVVTPQVWRHCSSTAVEEFVTGTDVWPECADEDLALQKESTLPSWWQEPDFGAAFLEDFFRAEEFGHGD